MLCDNQLRYAPTVLAVHMYPQYIKWVTVLRPATHRDTISFTIILNVLYYFKDNY